MGDSQIDRLIASAMDKIKGITNISTVVGEPIEIGSFIIIPVSKVSVGFIVCGGEYGADKKDIKVTKNYPFTGGSGGGVSVSPIGFIFFNGKDSKFIKVDGKTPYDKILESIPSIINSVVNGVKDDKNNKENK